MPASTPKSLKVSKCKSLLLFCLYSLEIAAIAVCQANLLEQLTLSHMFELVDSDVQRMTASAPSLHSLSLQVYTHIRLLVC